MLGADGQARRGRGSLQRHDKRDWLVVTYQWPTGEPLGQRARHGAATEDSCYGLRPAGCSKGCQEESCSRAGSVLAQGLQAGRHPAGRDSHQEKRRRLVVWLIISP